MAHHVAFGTLINRRGLEDPSVKPLIFYLLFHFDEGAAFLSFYCDLFGFLFHLLQRLLLLAFLLA